MNLGRNQSIVLNAALATSGAAYRLMVQTTPTADIFVGVDFTTRADLLDAALDYDNGTNPLSAGTSNLQINGTFRKFSDTVSVSSGQSVVLTLQQQDLAACLRGSGTRHMVLLVNTIGNTWVIGAQWALSVDDSGSEIWARITRLTDARVAVSVRCNDEDVVATAFTHNLGTVSQTWGGARHFVNGMKIFYAELPSNITTLTITATDTHGNISSIAATVPPIVPTTNLPSAVQPWQLAPWLSRTGVLLHLTEAITKSFVQPPSPKLLLNPATSSGRFLETHAALYRLNRFNLENDEALRVRVLAVLNGKFVTREAMESHLSAVAGARVLINDNTYARAAIVPRLDGSRQTDGTWQLGGVAATFAAASYLVSLTEPIDAPISSLLSELQRLRPSGILPVVQHRFTFNQPLALRLTGVLRIT